MMKTKNRIHKVVKIDYNENTDILYVRLEGYEKSVSTWDEEKIKGLIVGRDTKNNRIVGFDIEGFSSYQPAIPQDLPFGTYPENVYYDMPAVELNAVPLKSVIDFAAQKWLAPMSPSESMRGSLEVGRSNGIQGMSSGELNN